VHIPDLQPLLQALAKVSAGRIIEGVDKSESAGLTLLKIPVKGKAFGDLTDANARRYACSWVRENVKSQHRLRVSSAFIPLKPGDVAWFSSTGPVDILGMIQITIEESKEGSLDLFRKGHRDRRAKEKKAFYDTVKSSDS
jgi:hypothetical protein